MASNNATAVRKRSQIAKANRTMFLWIAVSSALVGSALVVAYFFVQLLVYNEKVLIAKYDTIATLEANNEAVPALEDAIRVLDTNEALAAAKANPDDQALQVILDALPSDVNSLALGASLQSKLLVGVDDITVESLQVTPVNGVESLSDASMVDASVDDGSGNYITFQFAVSGSQEGLKQILQNLERSIRLIDIQTLRIESQENGQLLTVSARAYYEPAKTFELKDKKVEK